MLGRESEAAGDILRRLEELSRSHLTKRTMIRAETSLSPSRDADGLDLVGRFPAGRFFNPSAEADPNPRTRPRRM